MQNLIEEYELLDSGDGQKFERFGEYFLTRPAYQALWKPSLSPSHWDGAHALFTRESNKQWAKKNLPDSWAISIRGIRFKIIPTDFGHLGVFPEQQEQWVWLEEVIRKNRGLKVLNLFAYSGGATLAAARSGAHVTHLDASKGMIEWARENAALNDLEHAPIRWIIDDAKKFLKRELKRNSRYDGIILDPPSFGRGNRGEIFKIEEDLLSLLEDCFQLLASKPRFILLTSHTPGYTPIVLENLIRTTLSKLSGKIEAGEMLLSPSEGVPLPCGTYARWSHEDC